MKLPLFRLLAGLGLLLCSAVAGAANHVVNVGGAGGNGFAPATLTIKRGDTVTFRNLGGVHNVVADDGSFRCSSTCYVEGYSTGGGPNASQWSQTITYSSAGSFGYYCSAHGGPGGAGMSGMIIVQDDGPAFSIGTAISGNWYSPGQSGHGFQLEKVNDTTVIGIWFTFDNNGNHAWIFASGTLDGNRVAMQAVRSRGGRFPPNFDQTQITNPPWGTLTFEFTGCNTGSVQWTSTDPAFSAAGTLPLERVTQVQGTSCP
jgi:plastocyanin